MKKKPATEKAAIPIARDASAKCAAQHYGPWSIEPRWFAAAMQSIREGTLKPFDDDDDVEPPYLVVDGIAIIAMEGQMTRRGSSFGGCSTVRVREALRAAWEDQLVRGIVLHINSPGGTVAGTSDLAECVLKVRKGTPRQRGKRVDAFVSDMGCSAAYWVASQCEVIYANTTAIVGSIGTYLVLEDDTGCQEQMGIRWRVVSTGLYKGLGADGRVTDELVADCQREVNELNAPFLAAVSAGRGKKITDIAAVSDGRAYVSATAITLGLIDEIASLDAAIQACSERSTFMNFEQFKAFAAEHPEAVAGYIEQGKNAGVAEGRKSERDRSTAIFAACAGRHSIAEKAIISGMEPDQVTLALSAAEDAEKEAREAMAAQQRQIEKLEMQVNQQTGVNTSGAALKAAAAKAEPNLDDPEARARAEWEANANRCNVQFSNIENYLGWRVPELKGLMRQTGT